MANTETIRMIFGVAGNVLSLFLFLSPLPTFYKMWKWKSTREFSSVPYVATLLNCLLWSFYGLPFVHPRSIPVLTINGAGCVLESAYLVAFFLYSNKETRVKLISMMLLVFLFMTATVITILMMAHTWERRTLIVGSLCVIFGTAMYVSPLSIMRQVIRTKSVRYMPFMLSLVFFFNALNWTAYACIDFDIFITIPNGLGVFFATLQLILYGLYYKTTTWDEEDDVKPKNPSRDEMINTIRVQHAKKTNGEICVSL